MRRHDGRASISASACIATTLLYLSSLHCAQAQSGPGAAAGEVSTASGRSGERLHAIEDKSEARPDGGEMTDLIKLTREWLDLVAMGPADAWRGRVAEDVVIRLPFAPPGVADELRGFDHARETLGEHWKTKQSFAWRDVVIRRTEDPELLLTTARSEVMLASGEPYTNDYIMLTRIRDGKITEHIEYFNPLPIIDMLKK